MLGSGIGLALDNLRSADMVMASASGLDPHISLRNAVSVYQLDRVANKRTRAGADGNKLREDIAALARSLSFTPLGGLIGAMISGPPVKEG